MDNYKAAEKVIGNFLIDGELEKIKVNTQGHINSTFVSTFIKDGVRTKYTHQKINRNVFKNPKEVMENIVAVTKHIEEKVPLSLTRTDVFSKSSSQRIIFPII